MKFATNVTLLFLSVTDSDIFNYFFMSQIWTVLDKLSIFSENDMFLLLWETLNLS